MTNKPKTIPRRTVGEWELRSSHGYDNPFVDVSVEATFTSPAGKTFSIPSFYDGDNTWRIRFNPDEVGRWQFRTFCRPANPDLTQEGTFEVTPNQARGFLRATPGHAWGFVYESGEPALIWGDTAYNLFGMAYCGGDVAGFLKRRAAQGFNLLRVRVPVSPFHPPAGYSAWQTRRTWPWGGSEQAPLFDRFNLDYFRTVDEVVRQAEALSLGLEMIMEAWGFEFPFNSRQIFVWEWEQLWLRYLIARYDAFASLYFWTPMNEYEYYPNGDWHYKPVADLWAMRIARWIKDVAPHGHVVSVHNGPREPAFAVRFKADPEAIDAIMFQEWGARDQQNGWLATVIEDQIARSLAGWHGSAVYAEYGYERNPDFDLLIPNHAYCSPEHTRRATWRGLFCALGVIHGFENSWGPWMLLEQDQPGMVYVSHARRFFTEIVPFHTLEPAADVVIPGDWPRGHRPLALASASRTVVAVYLPVGGGVNLVLSQGEAYAARWFDPRTGDLRSATPVSSAPGLRFVAPPGTDRDGHPWDWVLLMERANNR